MKTMNGAGTAGWGRRLSVPGVWLFVAVLAGAVPLSAQDGPPPEERAAIDALLGMLQSSGPDALTAYADEHVAPAYLSALGTPGAVEHFASVREATRGTLGSIGVELDPDGLLLMLSAERSATLRVVFDDDYRLTRLEVVEAAAADAPPSGPGDAIDAHMRAIEQLGFSPDAELAPRLTAEARDALGDDFAPTVALIRRAAASAGSVSAEPDGAGLVLRFRGGSTNADVRFTVEDEAPFLIDRIDVVHVVGEPGRAPAETLSWGGLEERLQETVAEGFAGTVLAVRDGEILFHRGFGQADRAEGRPNGPGIIYATGSMPIDLTRAAVLLAHQRGLVDLDDTIDRYLPDVPEDRRSMTLRHLLENRSGLPNFHHRDGDEDADLTWIDRETAERRIMASPLLFPPGTDSGPSHSGFVLLAAIVERASGQPYADFLRTNFFEPLGMEATGPFGTDLGHPLERFAVGYGEIQVGSPNIPPHWGPTSWLIAGSGGMVSTPMDMYRWFRGIREGRVLEGEALELYLDRTNVLGASDRGFFYMHAWGGGDTMIFASMNAGEREPFFGPLIRGMLELVASSGVPPGP